jgi:hypothetical protein
LRFPRSLISIFRALFHLGTKDESTDFVGVTVEPGFGCDLRLHHLVFGHQPGAVSVRSAIDQPAVHIFSQIQWQGDPTIAAASSMQIVIIGLLILVVQRIFRLRLVV